MKVATRWNVDKVGAYASAICAVHCVITGLALGLLSVVGLDFIGSPAAEAGFFLTAVGVGSWALVHGMRQHRSVLPAAIFVAGMGCLLVSHFVFGHGQAGHETLGGTLFSVFGGVSLVSFHFLNRRFLRTCACGFDHG
jgi:hypothetical protein